MSTKIRHIEVVPYNPKWPEMFEEEARSIRRVLGDNCIEINHIGSTSVPGLSAKPTIDIIAVIQDRESAITPLTSLGYECRGEFNIPMRLVFNQKPGTDVNLHVFERGHPEIELNIMFRNYLRTHPEAREEYAALKEELLSHKSSFEIRIPPFTGYNLGKDAFIRKTLQQAGYNRIRMLRCTHYVEWDAAKAFRQKYFFDLVPIADPYTWTFDHPEHVHLVLCQGTTIIGYTHLQLWPEQRAAMRIIVIDEPFRNQSFGRQFLKLCEQWLKVQGYQSLHIESRPESLNFYQQTGYMLMPFDDPENHETDPRDTAVGKML